MDDRAPVESRCGRSKLLATFGLRDEIFAVVQSGQAL